MPPTTYDHVGNRFNNHPCWDVFETNREASFLFLFYSFGGLSMGWWAIGKMLSIIGVYNINMEGINPTNWDETCPEPDLPLVLHPLVPFAIPSLLFSLLSPPNLSHLRFLQLEHSNTSKIEYNSLTGPIFKKQFQHSWKYAVPRWDKKKRCAVGVKLDDVPNSRYSIHNLHPQSYYCKM